MLKDKRFNFGGCHRNDLVSHYVLPMSMRCMFAVSPFPLLPLTIEKPLAQNLRVKLMHKMKVSDPIVVSKQPCNATKSV